MDVDHMRHGRIETDPGSAPENNPRKRRKRVAVAAALTAAVLLGGCGNDGDDSSDDEKTTALSVYFVDNEGKLVPVEHEVAGADKMSSQGRALAAVEALISETPEKESGLKSHWGGSCGVGASVKSLQKQSGLITLKVNGPGGVACNRKGPEELQQRQQLAWTIVENLGGAATTPVQMYTPNGAILFTDLVADESYLAN